MTAPTCPALDTGTRSGPDDGLDTRQSSVRGGQRGSSKYRFRTLGRRKLSQMSSELGRPRGRVYEPTGVAQMDSEEAEGRGSRPGPVRAREAKLTLCWGRTPKGGAGPACSPSCPLSVHFHLDLEPSGKGPHGAQHCRF